MKELQAKLDLALSNLTPKGIKAYHAMHGGGGDAAKPAEKRQSSDRRLRSAGRSGAAVWYPPGFEQNDKYPSQTEPST
jgi:hypothetical protein